MNEDYLNALDELQSIAQKRNKATFKKIGDQKQTKKIKVADGRRKDISTELGLPSDSSGLAFRKDTLKALNQDSISFKKIEMYHYIEKLRVEANKEIFDFFESVDPSTDSKNMKLLYFYFVGSRNLISEMTTEAVNKYAFDQMKPMRPEMRNAMNGVMKKRKS